MSRCITNKYQEAVQDDSILAFDEFDVHVSISSPITYEKARSSNSEGTVTLIGNGMLIQGGTESKSLTYSNQNFTVPAGDYILRFNNKYKITDLSIVGIDFKELEYLDELVYLAVQYPQGDVNKIPSSLATLITEVLSKSVYGNITSETPLLESSIARVNLSKSNISGDVSCFGKMSSITELIIAETQIVGSIENLVSNFVAFGKSSGSIVLCISGDNITIGEEVRTYRYTNTKLAWSSADTFYFQNGTDAEVTGQTNVTIYAKNATAEQIASWEADNNTVVEL